MKKVVGVVLVAVALLLALPWSGLAGHSNTRYFFGFKKESVKWIAENGL